MKYQSVDEIYAGNEKIRARLKDVLSRLSENQAAALPEGEKWTIAQIVEHVAIVDESTSKICARLLKQAQEGGQAFDRRVNISDNFLQKGVEIAAIKVEAPSFVQPSGDRTIPESLAKLEETDRRLEEMRPLFESVHSSDFKFPHPFVGEITAHEWLALKGGHELRHIEQIERLIGRLG
ncbi:MAG TPA: DinB family protein [Pyrinomonadaceae bacterium]